MKKFYLTLFFSFIIGIISSQESKKDYTAAFKLIEVWLESQKDFENIPSITALVVDDQDILWSGAFGLSNIEKSIKATTETLCSICSISKTFTAVAIMKLVDEEKLRLDDKVSTLLPFYNVKQQFPEGGAITVQSLLTHTSGLPRDTGHSYWNGPEYAFPTQAQMRSKLKDLKTETSVSTNLKYSNLGFTLLGEIIEAVSGISYSQYITQNILTPLKMSNTSTDLPESLYGSKLSIGYSAMTREGVRTKLNTFQTRSVKPAAGLTSNVFDMAKYISWQFRLRDSTITEILKPSTLKAMQRVNWSSLDGNSKWGLGFVVYKGSNGSSWASHSGLCPGFRSVIQMDLDNKRGFVVLINANGNSTNPDGFSRGIGVILNSVKSKKEKSKLSIKLQEYVGYYDIPTWHEQYVGISGDQLVTLNLPSGYPSLTFYNHVEGDTFRSGSGDEITFLRDENGNIRGHEDKERYYMSRINR